MKIGPIPVKIGLRKKTEKAASENDDFSVEGDELISKTVSVADHDETLPPLTNPGQKGTILFKVRLFTPTIDLVISEEEGAPVEATLDETMQFDEEDEEQALLM